MDTERQLRRTGWACLIAVCLLFTPSLYLHCASFALLIGLKMGVLGLLLGLSLAFVTRTRRAILIYLGLLVAFCAGWFFFVMLDSVDLPSFVVPRGAPTIWENYPVFLRIGTFLLCVPYPFARWGYHAPDAFSENSPPSGDIE